ncbi:MAG: hypothetical protein WDN24_09475 [Sphingomonas sp.]
MQKTHHILSSASNLLGITLLIIAGLHVSNAAAKSLSDEVAWAGAICFALSCFASYLSIRSDAESTRSERFADSAFMSGLVSLIASVLILAFSSNG